ncbi:hypothetical protein ACTQZM_10630 [Enterococcus cecorum]|uniref:hypothetical protein n=1 Tax=Enterococcus cecorum TaxID=44008 RepID=UPI003F92493A
MTKNVLRLFCEKSVYNEKLKEHTYILAFYEDDDLVQFSNLYNLQIVEDSFFIELKSVKIEKNLGFKKSFWYEIPVDFFLENNFIITENIENNNQAICCCFQYNSTELLIVNNYLINQDSFNRDLYYSDDTNFININYEDNNGLHINTELEEQIAKLEVLNVGVGNWNRFSYKDIEINFDFGAEMYFSENDVTKIINSNKVNANIQKRFFILSHFDYDHYRCMLNSNFDFNRILKVYIPSKLQKTKACTKLINILSKRIGQNKVEKLILNQSINKKIYLEKSNRHINFELIKAEIYKSTLCYKSNNRCLVLVLTFCNKKIIFSGDISYKYLVDMLLKYENDESKLFLIAPHHLGKDTGFSNYVSKLTLEEVFASTKSGVYSKIPQQNIHDYFNNSLNCKEFYCTDITVCNLGKHNIERVFFIY